MADNQEIISFPFRPHLAKYLWALIKNDVLESEDQFHKPLDIDLRSIDGKLIRLLMERTDFPDIEKVTHGFRLYVSVPKNPVGHRSYLEDGRYNMLTLKPEAIELINDIYETRFRDHLITFISGYIRGKENKRGAINSAIQEFRKIYNLSESEMSFDNMVAYYKRTNSPVKNSIYAKKKCSIVKSKEKSPRKDLITRYIKK